MSAAPARGSRGPGRRRGRKCLHRRLQPLRNLFERGARAKVILGGKRLACGFNAGACVGERGAKVLHRLRAGARGFGGLQTLRRQGDAGRGHGEQPLRLTAHGCLLARRFGGRRLGTLAAVERSIQRETVVALRDGLLGLPQRVDRRLEFVGRVLPGPGGTGCIDGPLGLVHLPVGRLRAGNRDGGEENEQDGEQTARHCGEYSPVAAGAGACPLHTGSVEIHPGADVNVTIIPPRVVDAVRGARRGVVLTGAGISAESGIPTFRGSGGLWRSWRPEDLASPIGFARDPAAVWAWYRWRQGLVARARPNAGHEAIAALGHRDPGWQVLTQNVDGLHTRAGTPQVIELHGSIWRVSCTAGCGRVAQPDMARVPPEDAPLPYCVCGALQRPAVVWFGEPLDPAVVEQAWQAVEACDVLLVVGTSAVVYPVAALPERARERGAIVVEINIERTALSSRVDAHITAPAAVALPALVAAL